MHCWTKSREQSILFTLSLVCLSYTWCTSPWSSITMPGQKINILLIHHALKMTKCQTLKKFRHIELFDGIYYVIWHFFKGRPVKKKHPVHILRAYVSPVILGYLEPILLHPSQNFADKLHLHFYDNWYLIIYRHTCYCLSSVKLFE